MSEENSNPTKNRLQIYEKRELKRRNKNGFKSFLTQKFWIRIKLFFEWGEMIHIDIERN